MDAMTDSELEEIEKACAEATPGPWTEAKGRIVAQPDPPNGPWERICTAAMPWSADAYLIANARSWVPALVAEVKRLRERVEIWQDNEVAKASACDAHCEGAVAQEREECAKLCERLADSNSHGPFTIKEVAAAIRARGKP